MARKRNGSFPESVQPGLPVLESLPNGWQREPLGKRVKEIQRPVKMQDDAEYDLVTVKRSRGGAVKRETLLGKSIKVKSQFAVHSGDFLISKRQIVHGACAIVPNELHGAIVSNEYSVLNCTDTLDSIFFKYLSETKYFQQTCFHSSIGVHVEKMVFKLERWFKWEFNFPPHREQQKIARILSTWDTAIDCTQKLLENSKQQKKALMQQLLTGNKRLHKFVEIWKTRNLKDLGEFHSGTGFPEEYQGYLSGKYPFFKVSDMNHAENSIRMLKSKNWIDDRIKKEIKAKIFPKGSVIFAKIGAAIFLERKRILAMDSCLDNNLMCFIPNNKINPSFIYYIFILLNFGNYASTTALPYLGAKDLENISISIPHPNEQTAIAKVLSSCDDVIAQYEARLANLQTQKKALMQQLLTGKKRVTVDAAVSDNSAA